MKILLVNIYFHPDPTGTGLVLTELARDLVAQGHTVTVVTSVPHYGVVRVADRETGGRGDEASGRRSQSLTLSPSPRPPVPPSRRFRLWSEARMDGIRVLRTAVYVPRHKTFWARALNYVSFSALAPLAGLVCGPQDVILCASPPLLLGASVALLSGLKRVPFVFNVQDIYPDAALLMGMLRNQGLVALSRLLERWIYRRAALVTVISETAKQNLRAKGVPEAKIAVIPNWADVEYLRPLPADNEFRRSVFGVGCSVFGSDGLDGDGSGGSVVAGLGTQHPTPNTQHPTPNTQYPTPNTQHRPPVPHVVMFAGNIGLIAGLETVLDAAAALRDRADIHFLIVGEGNAKAGLVDRARQMDLPNVTFLPTQPREILPQVLAAADVHLVTLKRRMSTTSVPSKSYSMMASGRPLIAAVDPGSEVWRLVEEADAGVCVPPEEPAALARAIESLCDAPERRRRFGENARVYVVRHHAKPDLTARYERTLEAVSRNRAPDTDSDVAADPVLSHEP